MKEKLEQVLADLKAIGINVVKIESDLGFSNGLIGKAKSGKANLSEEKFDAIMDYYKKNIPEAKQITTEPEYVDFIAPEKKPKVEIMLGSEFLKSTPMSPFRMILAEFNALVLEQPPISQVKDKLIDILSRAENPEFTVRQVEAVRERCLNYLKGIYGVSSKKDSYNQNK
jgi:hypothetical protein